MSSLTAWYRPRRDRYPWRVDPSPYRTLVSEVMLQQTQAARVAPIFERFIERFPSIGALARASRADVLRAWDGLGYNRRAVRLSEAARAIVREHGGEIPSDPEILRTLPGIGPYTAAAISALVFGRRVAAIDVNVRRVVSRVRLGTGDAAHPVVTHEALAWMGRSHPGTWHQAVMDLGREICRPVPRCDGCPVAGGCLSANLAAPIRTRVPQPRFRGSSREARGAVVSVLRGRASASLSALVGETGLPPGRVREAVAGLVGDGVLEAAGAGTVRLAEG